MPDAPLSNAYRIPLNQLDVITARLYAENGYPHDAWRRLRAEDEETHRRFRHDAHA